jgi:hypothetical protein
VESGQKYLLIQELLAHFLIETQFSSKQPAASKINL